ncbi:MAG: trypsin-like peptidase domain-containing protein [Pyrinomonadaceae bacterium]
MITSNFIHRTFRIRSAGSIGTAFTVDIDTRQYLVTARHVVEQIDAAHGIEVFGNNGWIPLPIKLVGHCSNEIDISVLAPRAPLSPPGLPIRVSSDGLAYGQDLFFLGFLYHFLGNVSFTDNGYPLPFVKRATFSCFADNRYLLDGHNNPGFSGGPVIFGVAGAVPTNVAAVISGYKFVPEAVYHQGNETELTFKYNTGIIVSYKIENALELVRKNPIGAQL